MKTFVHTRLTHQVRSNFELAAIEIMGLWENISVDEMEERYRGRPSYEEAVRKTAAWLQDLNEGVDFKPFVESAPMVLPQPPAAGESPG